MAMPLKNRTFFADSLIVLVCGRMKIMSIRNFRYIRVELMVLILDGNSEYDGQARRKMILFGKKTNPIRDCSRYNQMH